MSPIEVIRGNADQITAIFNKKKEREGWRPVDFGNDDKGPYLVIHRPPSVSVVELQERGTLVIGEEKILEVQRSLEGLFFRPGSQGGPAMERYYQKALEEGKSDDLVFLFPKPYNRQMSVLYLALRQDDVRTIPDLLNLPSREIKKFKGIGDKGIVAINTIRNILLNKTP